jgi:hypothetical protein
MSNLTGAGLLTGKWPAVVRKYRATERLVEVEIPGITDGHEDPLLAEIEYPIGDKSAVDPKTEIEILEGDKVWIEFIQGDPRYPLITGYRNPASGNDAGTRRWRHKAVEILAEETITLKVGDSTITLTGGSIKVESGRIDLN